MRIKDILTTYSNESLTINTSNLEKQKIFNSCYVSLIFILANNPTLTINLCGAENYCLRPQPYAATFIYDPNIDIDEHTKELIYVFTRLSYNPHYSYESALCWTRYNIINSLNPYDWTLNNKSAPIAKIINNKNNFTVASLRAVNQANNKQSCRIQLTIYKSMLNETIATNLNDHYFYKINNSNDPVLIDLTTKTRLCFPENAPATAAQKIALCITHLLLRKKIKPIV
jgi:hypothetical protein